MLTRARAARSKALPTFLNRTRAKPLDRNVGNADNAGMLKSYLTTRGNLARLARSCGVSHSTVLGWVATRVPAERVHAVAAATGLTPETLRPDLFANNAGVIADNTNHAPGNHGSVTE